MFIQITKCYQNSITELLITFIQIRGGGGGGFFLKIKQKKGGREGETLKNFF